MPLLPGEEIEVAVTTTDPQGKPVSAEASLAMVEQSLLDRFGWKIPAIGDFFRAERRQPVVRSTSSITFAYTPQTRPINALLLAEEDRLDVSAEEVASLAAMELQRQSELNRQRSEVRERAAVQTGHHLSADDPFAVPAAAHPNEPAVVPGTQVASESQDIIAAGVRPETRDRVNRPAGSGSGSMGGRPHRRRALLASNRLGRCALIFFAALDLTNARKTAARGPHPGHDL